MTPIIHGMIAWLIATLFVSNVNDRRLIVIVGVVADIDGVFILFDNDAYYTYHHTFGHSLVFGITLALIAGFLAFDRLKVILGAISAFCMHLVADIFGSSWAVSLFYPVSDFNITSSGFLTNNIIYNVINPIVFIICLALILITMYYRDISPFEFISVKLDNKIVNFVFPMKLRQEQDISKK